MENEKKFRKHILQAVYAFKELLDKHCANGDAASSIAAQFNISRNVLQEGFKNSFGMGIRDYKLRKRMERSRKLLTAGKDIKEIAIILHYTKPRAFSTAFKRYYGITPSAYSHSLKTAMNSDQQIDF